MPAIVKSLPVKAPMQPKVKTSEAIANTADTPVQPQKQTVKKLPPRSVAIDHPLKTETARPSSLPETAPLPTAPIHIEQQLSVSLQKPIQELEIAQVSSEATIPLQLPAYEGIAIEQQSFELYAAAAITSAETESPATIEAIVQDAPEQPLEVTFIALAACLSQTIEASPDSMPIRELLADIAQEIEELLENEQITEIIMLPLDLTQKIVTLLETLGYENAGEVLAECISTHSLSFLLEGIQYVAQAAEYDTKPELTPRQVTTFTTDDSDDSMASRLGKMIIHIIKNFSEPVELATI